MLRSLAVVGTGLIGTSVALAARRQGTSVHLLDRDVSAVRTAAALGAGVPGAPADPVELAVLAVPPSQIGAVLVEQQARGLALSYTDVASVKAGLEREVLDRAADPSCYVGGHPLAGRERSGPLAARADLFRGRPWVLTPSRLTSKTAFDRVLRLVAMCGGVPVAMRSEAHDDVVALISHVPHLMATLTAARLVEGPAGATLLAGQGLRDVTRIAAGDSRLWSDILQANAAAIAEILGGLHEDLSRLRSALDRLAGQPAADRAECVRTLVELLDRGIAGLEEIPATPVGTSPHLAHVHAVTAGRPGELPRMLEVAAEFGVVADGAIAGEGDGDRLVVRFPVPPLVADRLVGRLRSEGWRAGHGEEAATGEAPPPAGRPGPTVRGSR